MMKKSFENVISEQKIAAVVIGTSAGGISALEILLKDLPAVYAVPIIIVQHISANAQGYFIKHFQKICALPICEVNDMDAVTNGKVFFAPPGYHLMIEPDKTFSLCVSEKISYSRPSIDVLFSTAAGVYQSHLLGIILTGANQDGKVGARQIKKHGGLMLVQKPLTAESPVMPEAVIKSGYYDAIATIETIASLLKKIG